jgi:hypothetical protein
VEDVPDEGELDDGEPLDAPEALGRTMLTPARKARLAEYRRVRRL